jgi:hypothetical protein
VYEAIDLFVGLSAALAAYFKRPSRRSRSTLAKRVTSVLRTIQSMRSSFLTKSTSRFHHSYLNATIGSILVTIGRNIINYSNAEDCQRPVRTQVSCNKLPFAS